MIKFENSQNENSLKITRPSFRGENRKLKIIFLGTPNYVNPIIKSLEKNFDLIKTIRSPKDSLDEIKNLQPDLLVVASFGRIIPQEILEIPKLGAINIHPSKLPLYRGPSPIQSQILDGITDSAISFILMDSEMDHGPIIYQEPFRILATDTFQSLLEKMFGASAALLPTVIKSFADNKLKPVIQNSATASFCNTIKKGDGYFDIENPPSPDKLDRMIRAFHPWPGCWTKWNNKIVKMLPEGKIQMEGKSPTDLKSFLNGYPNFPLTNL